MALHVYVSLLTGSDANDGLSWSTSKYTIQAGIWILDAGGTLHIAFEDYFRQPLLHLSKSMDLLCENVGGGGTGTVVLPYTFDCDTYCQTKSEPYCTIGCDICCQTCVEGGCQTACQLGCQATCELACQLTCELTCQLACELLCQTKGE